jgi:hypothetical protein
MEKKKCSGCKEQKNLEAFYKNKNMKDGHSNYCIDCTKDNSKKYFERRKQKYHSENEEIIKMVLLSNLNNTDVTDNKLLKLMLIEKLSYALMDEITKLKEMIANTADVDG